MGYSGYIQTCEYVDFLPSPAVVVLNDCCNKVHGDNKSGVLKLFLKSLSGLFIIIVNVVVLVNTLGTCV